MRFTAFPASTCLYFTAIHFPKFPSLIQQHRCRPCLLHSRITHSREIHSWILQHINPILPQPSVSSTTSKISNFLILFQHPQPTSSIILIHHQYIAPTSSTITQISFCISKTSRAHILKHTKALQAIGISSPSTPAPKSRAPQSSQQISSTFDFICIQSS